MIVEPLDRRAGDAAAWDDYVRRAAGASHSHLLGWRRVIEVSYGHRSVYLWARDGDRVKGVLPLVLIRDILGRRVLVSLPFLDDGGICAEDGGTRQALLEGALRAVEAWRARDLDVRHRDPSGLALAAHGEKVVPVLDLEPDPDRMWTRLDGKVRNQVRKATTAGLTATWSGIEGLDGFYAVFAENMRDLGSPVHARRFFAAVLEEFADSAKLVLVRRDGVAIAGGLCLFFRDRVLMPWASSLKAHRSACPNNLLYWEAIRLACEKGYTQFDFGRSSPGSGTHRFKKQWGAVDRPLHWQRLPGEGRATPMADANQGPYRFAAAAWSRLPLSISRVVGPALRRHLSN